MYQYNPYGYGYGGIGYVPVDQQSQRQTQQSRAGLGGTGGGTGLAEAMLGGVASPTAPSGPTSTTGPTGISNAVSGMGSAMGLPSNPAQMSHAALFSMLTPMPFNIPFAIMAMRDSQRGPSESSAASSAGTAGVAGPASSVSGGVSTSPASPSSPAGGAAAASGGHGTGTGGGPGSSAAAAAAAAAADAANATADADSAAGTGGGGGGGGSKVICTALHGRGMLPTRIYRADAAFGRKLALTDPDAMAGYHAWGKPLADLINRSKIVAWIVYPLAAPWAYHIAGHKNPIGWAYLKVGIPICRFFGKSASKTKAHLTC